MLEEIHHFGHAVEDLEEATRFYGRNLGATAGEPEEVPHQGVRVVMLVAGQSRVELLKPTRPDSPGASSSPSAARASTTSPTGSRALRRLSRSSRSEV